jgi:aspartyl-tRNA(Asn)/glutamyl-tRNA(Gln) amidotransferase subunit A
LPEIELPDRSAMNELAGAIQAAEATAFHRDWMRRWPDRYSADVLAKLRSGLEVLAVDYLRALDDRRRLRVAVDEALGGWDSLLLPATAVVAPRLDGPEEREALLRFTRPFSLTGQPSIVIPAPAAGLSVGIQLVGRFGADADLAAVAAALEQTWPARPAY